MRFLGVEAIINMGPRRSMRLNGAKFTSVPRLIDKPKHELLTFCDPTRVEASDLIP